MLTPLSPPPNHFFTNLISNIKYWIFHHWRCLKGRRGHFGGHFIPEKDDFMTYRSYLIRKTPHTSYLFRIKIPQDLRGFFEGRTQFKISLKNGIHSESIIYSKIVYLEVQSIFEINKIILIIVIIFILPL